MWLIILLFPALLLITDFVRFGLGARKSTLTFWAVMLYFFLKWRENPLEYARMIEEEIEN